MPGAASAHAVSGIDYRFPLPIWLFALAAGVAVLALGPRGDVRRALESTSWTGGDFYGSIRAAAPRDDRARRLHARPRRRRSSAASSGPKDFFENPATIVVWVDFWVGLGIVTALVGNAWDFVSPLSAAGRALERALAFRGAGAVRYPERLGLWPATALVLLWSWMELVWDQAKEPLTLTLILLAYVALQLLAMVVFGTEVWLARGELFTVVARTLARFAPVELYVAHARPASCRANRCVEEERVNCPSCWLDADPDDRGMRLRTYGSGCGASRRSAPGGGTFVLALLATVVYDGFSQTQKYVDLESWFLDRSTWLALHETLLDSLIMVAVVGAFALAFLLVVTAVSRLERPRSPTPRAATRPR